MFNFQKDSKARNQGLGFVAGTRVHTKDGLKPIETLQVGDWVLSHPEHESPPPRRRKRNEYLYRRVIGTACVDQQPIVLVTVLNLADDIKDTLRVATGQPIWTKQRGWIAAGQMSVTQTVVLSFNGNALVEEIRTAEAKARVYRLEVEEYGTYYVEQLGVWVSGNPAAVKEPAAAPETRRPFDFSQSQVILDIKDYYNDTLTDPNEPEPPSETLTSRRPDSILITEDIEPPPMPEEQAEKLRQDAEAIRRFAREKMRRELNYDEEGVRWMQEYIEQARLKGEKDKWQGFIDLIGAFLGECMVRNFGGYWVRCDDSAAVWVGGFGIAFPFNKTFKQFEYGTEGGDAILGLYSNVETFRRINHRPLTPTQELFLSFACEGDQRVFISHKLGETPEWREVKAINGRWVELLGQPTDISTISTALIQVERFYVCLPDGRLRYTEGIVQADWKTLPPDIAEQLNSHFPLPDDLVELLRNGAESLRKRLRVELNYDEDGVRRMAEYIEWQRTNLEKEEWRKSVEELGAFLGECLVRNFGGRWVGFHNQVAVYIEGFGLAFPMNEVFRQFYYGNGESDSILTFYCGIEPFLPHYKPLTAAQVRLQAFVREGRQRIFIACDGDNNQTEWWEVKNIKGSRVMLVSESPDYSVSVPLAQVRNFYVCSPDGQLLHTQGIPQSAWETLPPDILEQIKRNLPADTSLSLGQMERGKQFIEIEYGSSNHKKEGYHYYSTSLKNISTRKIKIARFGGYTPQGGTWQLANVTGDFYTADDFKDWYEQKGEWLLPGETACDVGNWGHPPVLWAYYGVTDAGESFIAGKILEKPIASSAYRQGYSGAHYVLPMQPEPEMEQIINKLRSSYQRNRPNAFSLPSIMASKPSWMKDDDELNEIFRQQELLLKEGKIVWGALIMANALLFKPGDSNCPAVLVYSPDAYFDSRPLELRLIARKTGQFKETNPTDPELKEIARVLTDEVTRTMSLKLPEVFSDKEIRWTTFMVFRQHIPNGVLFCGLFPILIHPSTPAVMMVPFEFWPRELIILWNEQKL
jgi:hypothetical protein